MSPHPSAWRGLVRVLALSCAAALSACTTLSGDGGMSVPSELAARHLRTNAVALRDDADTARIQSDVAALLRKPLTADRAIQIALYNNRGLQAAYNELGIADAVRVQQSLPPNPAISVSRLAGAAETEVERQIAGSILALATLPARKDIADEQFRHAQLAAALETLRLGNDTRRAFYHAVAARQLGALLAQARDAAATSAELARRLGDSGAMNKLDQARQKTLHADLSNDLARAEEAASADRERLVRLLGLTDAAALRIPAKLPALPARLATLPAVERQALDERVDLQMARSELEVVAKINGLTKATRFIDVLDVGYTDKRVEEKPSGGTKRSSGFSLTLEVPLFDFGSARVAEAEQTYMRAVNRLAQKAVDARSQAREAYRSYRLRYDIAARYRREVLPLRQTITDEMMLRYGAMQVDVFTLLTEARQRIAAHVAAVEAERDFWLASATVAATIPGGGEPSSERSSMASAAAPAAAGH